MNNSILKIAVGYAEKSPHRMRTGAVIFDKRYIISAGTNHPCRSIRHLRPKFTRWKGSAHAEVLAIINAKCDLRGCSILVVRINRKGELRLAKPCDQCLAYLGYVGIKYCYYSTNDGIINKERI